MREEDKQVYYLYRHIRLDKNEPFYIGIGKVYKKDMDTNLYNRYYSRAFHKHSRNKYWSNIVNITEYNVEILMETTNKKYLVEKEIEFISLYGRKDLGTGILCNLTGGGEGTREISNEEREQRSKKMKGKLAGELNPMYGRKGKLSPNFGIPKSEEQKIKQSLKLKGKGLNGDNPSAKPIINYRTKEERGCAKEVSEELGIKYSTFCYMLRFKKFNTTYYMYKEDYDKGLKPNELLTKKYYPPIINVKTEELYSNTKYVCNITDIKQHTLLRYLNGELKNPTDYMLYSDFLKGLKPQEVYKERRR